MKSKYILDFGNAYESKTPEANEIHRQFCEAATLAESETDPARKEALDKEVVRLRIALVDAADTRRFCVVYDTSPGYPVVRTILRVSEDAETHLDEFKEEYYREYAVCEGDKFHFTTGLHRAQAFAASVT